MIELAILLVFQVYGLFLAGRSSVIGFTPKQHPAAIIGIAIGLNNYSLKSNGYLGLGFLALLLSLLLSGFLGAVFAAAAIVILAPVSFYAVMAAKADARFRLRKVVFFNPIPTVGTSFERVIKAGVTEDISEPIVLYMPPDIWEEIGISTGPVRLQFEGGKRIGPGLYRASGDNDFLHSLDSLGLWRFIVHPGNERAMRDFAEALEFKAAAARAPAGDLYASSHERRDRSASPAPARTEPGPKPPRSPAPAFEDPEPPTLATPPAPAPSAPPAPPPEPEPTPAPVPEPAATSPEPKPQPVPEPPAAAPNVEPAPASNEGNSADGNRAGDAWERDDDVLPPPPTSLHPDETTPPPLDGAASKPPKTNRAGSLRRPSTRNLSSKKPDAKTSRIAPPSDE